MQVAQNKVARTVTKKDIYIPTKVLIKECGWFNVRKLMVYHRLLQLHKTVEHQTPTYLFKRYSSQLGMVRRPTTRTTRQGMKLMG